MSTPIQTNTNELMAVLQQVRALPDATDLTPIVEALIEKGQTVPDGADVNALAALIEAIEAGGSGDLITGTFTCVSETENVILENAIPIRKKSPILYWICETGVNESDKTHTKRRLYGIFGLRCTWGEDAADVDSYRMMYMYSAAGSNSVSANSTKSAGVWKSTITSSTSITMHYDAFTGYHKQGDLIFGCNGTSYGLISGRTYLWGVMVWPE